MANEIIVAVDAMGGDLAPQSTVQGSIDALSEVPNLSILLVGDSARLEAELQHYTYDASRLTIVHASEVIDMHESPTLAIKKKKDSSLVVGLHLLKEGKAGALVSAGNTGALLGGATVIVGRIPGVERPALGTMLPNEKGFSFLIDSGANVDCKPSYLLQFAQIGSVYMSAMRGIQNPSVGLCNIGAEKEKGNALTKEAYALLDQAENVHFIGNAEARDIPHGVCDVVVCDAFVGNILLKYSEGFSKALLSMIKEQLLSSTVSKIGAALSKNAFRNLKKKFDYTEIGGAPFLGLKALVVKAHGSSNAKAFKNAIKQCSGFVEQDLTTKIQEAVKKEDSHGIRKG